MIARSASVGVRGLVGGGHEQVAGAGVPAAAQLEEQHLLGGEVHVDPGGGEPGPRRDVAGGRRVEAPLGEGVGRGEHDPHRGVGDVTDRLLSPAVGREGSEDRRFAQRCGARHG